MTTGNSEFNEVFFNDVFVPDDDVVGPVDGGWTVARATLGNESVSIGGGQGGMSMPGSMMVTSFDEHPERLVRWRRPHRPLHRDSSGDGLAQPPHASHRAVAGGGPGPGGRDDQAAPARERSRGGRDAHPS